MNNYYIYCKTLLAFLYGCISIKETLIIYVNHHYIIRFVFHGMYNFNLLNTKRQSNKEVIFVRTQSQHFTQHAMCVNIVQC